MAATGDCALTEEEWRDPFEAVGAAGEDWRRAEELLVDAIRRAASRRPGTIGRHRMSVRLAPRDPNATITFLPAMAHHATALGETVEVAYTPWLVAPDESVAPCLLVGGMSTSGGLFSYEIAAPPVSVDQRLKAAMQSQRDPS